ncbi:sensor domain-containing diguanylate cyclase [Magnetococcus sp. PR-3]|uniref:sensor domain-containing diguanylate cyclase n=1 Tax=Magnetococcus sp. PR-3 TaxID=3120355 RepID=UPI002FCE1FB1
MQTENKIEQDSQQIQNPTSKLFFGWKLTPPFTLKRIVHHHYLTSALVPILAIDLVLLLLYFGITSYLSQHNGEALRQTALTNMHGFIQREAQNLNQRLAEISRTALLLQDQHSRFFQMAPWQGLALPYGEPEFATHTNGAYHKRKDNGGSSLYYSSGEVMDAQQKAKARASEWLDPMLKKVVNTHPLVAQAYLNTHDNMNRLYPFMVDAPGQYGASLDMEVYNFYYLADPKHNPQRKPVWTNTYLDPAGQGWMVSCVVPIYNGDLMEGVTGLDVTIRNFVDHVLSLKLPWSGSAFLLDERGTILAMPPRIEEILGLKELKEHVYKETVERTVLRPEAYNILKHPDPYVQEQFHKLLGGEAEQGVLATKGSRFLLAHQKVPETGWKLVTLVDESVLLSAQHRLDALAQRIGLLAGVGVVLFYVLFFLYLSRKSLKLSGIITQPLQQLANQARNFGRRLGGAPLSRVGVVEVDSLTDTFNTMTRELEHRTEKLIEMQIESQLHAEKAKLYARQVCTDALTGLYTASEMVSLAGREMARSRRYHQPLSLLLVHLSDPSQASGQESPHSLEARVKGLANLLSELLREVDMIGRWQEDQFLILSPATELKEMALLAERLELELGNRILDGVGHIKLAMSVVQLQDEVEAPSLIQTAQKVLDHVIESEGRGVLVVTPQGRQWLTEYLQASARR